jgi:hypothetical protein
MAKKIKVKARSPYAVALQKLPQKVVQDKRGKVKHKGKAYDA